MLNTESNDVARNKFSIDRETYCCDCGAGMYSDGTRIFGGNKWSR